MENLRIGNKSLIKDINRALVIREIRNKGPISRTQISKNTKLVLSTITKICDELLEQNIIFSVGEGKSTGGRKPINLVFNNNYSYIIGVKIEDKHIIMALTNLKPIIISTKVYEYAKRATFDTVHELLIKGISELVEEIKERNGKLQGIGIAVSGIVDQENGRLISSSLLGWKNINFKSIIKEKFNVSVYLDNDVNCYALAQKWFGKGKDNRNFVCVTIGEGIGSGIIIDDRLYRGAIGGAGEIGHMIINVDGRQCYCGQRGCLEAHASEGFIIEYVKEKTGKLYTIEQIIELAGKGDADSLEAIKIACNNIGYGLINVIMHFNPEKIIISGKEIKEKKFIISNILESMNENWFHKVGAYETKIEIDELSNEKFLLGASILVLSELLGEPIYKDKKTLINNI
ncbi:ROK family protein [Caloranaerobacter ferrireducens]|uniref:ROK family protein n=1 Tax=Caloranaerobacter ferrireducens TaxID=1323370 RepID=UPI00084D3BCB|nr:ROK family protein [Caloranaerobacter ferrireducens]